MAFSISQDSHTNGSMFPLLSHSAGTGRRETATVANIARQQMDSYSLNIQAATIRNSLLQIQRVENGQSLLANIRPLRPEEFRRLDEWNENSFTVTMLQGNTLTERREDGSARKANVSSSSNLNSNSSLSVDVDVSVATGGGGSGSTGNSELDRQTAVNMEQAKKIKNQLRLDDRTDWGLDSLAQDLAVFGLDFSSMSGGGEGLPQIIQDKAQEMLAGTGGGIAGRNRITGALSRLANGLAGASMGAAADWSVSSDIDMNVNIGGKDIDAGFVIDVGNVVVDPLALDLEGDGLDLRGMDEGVDFDMDGDGTAERMGFIQGDDALLFEDTHGDGLVHDGRQLFGNTDGHANGFEKLRAYDDNGDGVIDRNDAAYDRLRVWVEKTVDGVSEAGETMSLEEAGVASINVGYENVREDDGAGNLIGQKGGFTRDDGTTGLAADVWFQEQRTPQAQAPRE